MTIDSKTLIAAVAVAALLLPIGTADNNATPANKAAAAGSGFRYLGTAADPLAPTAILDTFIRTGGPEDVVIQVALECSLLTDVFSTTKDEHPEGYTAIGKAEAHVVVWVAVDGVPVTISADDEDGKVTFCDRVHQQELRDIDDSTGNFTVRQFQETMTANAFNWVALDLGSAIHHVQVFATIEADNTEGSFAQGAIAKRTLIVEPVQFSQGYTVDTHVPADQEASAASSSSDSSEASSAPVPGVEQTSIVDLSALSGLL
jgi:hypothetical protein